jgi:membrane dipeptidase
MPSYDTLTRREFARLAAAVPVVGIGMGGELASHPGADRNVGRWDRYGEAIVIDALASPGPFNVADSLAQPLTDEMVRNAKLSGITAVNLTLGAGGQGHQSFDNAVASIGYWERELAAHPDALTKVRSVGELEDAKAAGRLGLIYGFQDSAMLEGDLERLQLFHNLGVRIIQLTYNVRNLAGDGCLEPAAGGLSRFGHSLVERMNDLGMLIDLSHCSAPTTEDGIEASRGPVAITHSGCKAVYDHPRSKSDDVLRRMADKGGVLGIYLMPFLNASGPATADDVLRHIEHAINVCGEDHVGIGSDQSITPVQLTPDYIEQQRVFSEQRQRLRIAAPREDELLFVPEINTPLRLEVIADMLLRNKNSEARVEKIVGGNFARLFAEVWD